MTQLKTIQQEAYKIGVSRKTLYRLLKNGIQN